MPLLLTTKLVVYRVQQVTFFCEPFLWLYSNVSQPTLKLQFSSEDTLMSAFMMRFKLGIFLLLYFSSVGLAFFKPPLL